ncbi:MAG: Fur family transcriptional regulator [Solirubrobacteraceae bacterium]
MTEAPNVKPLAFADLADEVTKLRSAGLRLTTARRLTLEALFEADVPLSAEEVAMRSSLDLTSVYRNLEMLERHGFARHVHLGHGPGRYVLVGRGEREYLFCESCGELRPLSGAELEPIRAKLREQFGYEARFTHFPIVGRCGKCAQSARSKRAAATAA